MNSCHFCLGLQLIRYCWILVVLHKVVPVLTQPCADSCVVIVSRLMLAVIFSITPILYQSSSVCYTHSQMQKSVVLVLGVWLNLIYRNSKLHLINLQRAVKPIGILPPHWLQKQNLWINSQTNMKRHICNLDAIKN